MKTFAKHIEDRKVLVNRLVELTGEPAHYTRVPRCAYEIGAFTVEMDGTLTVYDDADESILSVLEADNLIDFGCETGETPSQPDKATKPEAAAPTAQEVISGDEDWTPEEEADETVIAFPEETAEMTAPAEAPTDQATEDTSERLIFPMDASISFPLDRHSATSVINLVCMVFSRGSLLSKATGGDFHVSKALIDEMLTNHTFRTRDEVVSFLKAWDDGEQAIRGISFEDDKMTIDGFKAVKDAEHLQAYTKLTAAMNKMALTQERVQAKVVDDSNEKYALRIWMIRLGMNGADYKAERKILMENLSGHTAFRNQEEKDRWTARQQAKKDALKAVKEGAQA